MLPLPTDIQYFLEVAETLNISRAAERIGITQPSMSLAIRRLEDAVGTQLLIRSKTGVQLSRNGQQFVLKARSLLDQWGKLKAESLKATNEIVGRFTIGCHPSVAMYTLPHFLPEVLKHQGIEISLKHDLSRKITEDVISFKTDFGLVINPVKHPDLVIKTLAKDEVTFWTHSKPGPLQNPKNEDAVLICDPELLQTQDLLKKLSKKGYLFRRVIHSSNLEVITAMVSAKVGVGLLPGRVAQRIPSQGLKKLDKSMPIFHDTCCLVYRADIPNSAASRYIIDQIKKGITA